MQELTKQWEKLRNRNENAGTLRKQLAADTLGKVHPSCIHLMLLHAGFWQGSSTRETGEGYIGLIVQSVRCRSAAP